MFDLENLDLELDEDFAGGPFDTVKPREPGFNRSLGPSENKIDTMGYSLISNEAETRNGGKGSSERNRILDLISTSSSLRETNNTSGNHKILDAIFPNRVPVNNVDSSTDFNEFKKSPVKETNSAKRFLTERKFPGPAGLLPDKPLKGLSDVHLILEGTTENIAPERQEDSIILCSQSHSVFSEASFKKLQDDFDMKESHSSLNDYNICWVKKEALKNTFCDKKIPFLAVVLQNVDPSSPDPVLMLKDATGEIYGTLHREVWAELGSKLHPGAAVALKQVGVLITGTTRKQVYLNITINNILTIYSYSDGEDVEINIINKVNSEDIIKSISDWQSETVNKRRNSTSPIIGNGAWSNSVTSDKSRTETTVRSPSYPNSDKPLQNISVNSNPRRYAKETNFGASRSESCNGGARVVESNLVVNNVERKNNSSVSVPNKYPNRLQPDLPNELNRKRKAENQGESSSKLERPLGVRKEPLAAASAVKKISPQENGGPRPFSDAEDRIVEEFLDEIDFGDFGDF